MHWNGEILSATITAILAAVGIILATAGVFPGCVHVSGSVSAEHRTYIESFREDIGLKDTVQWTQE